MTPKEKKLLEALAWMSEQHLRDGAGLDHVCMSAGERAIEVLYEYGLVQVNKRGTKWTELGEKILDEAN